MSKKLEIHELLKSGAKTRAQLAAITRLDDRTVRRGGLYDKAIRV